MEPRIQYATTTDGVSIAFWSMGEGVPIVNPPPAAPWSHVEREWQIPEWRHWYEHLIEHARIVRYDGRGSGLSERGATETTIDAAVLDLEAVVDHLGLERFALFGVFSAGLPAIAYAAKHPDRVSHLILWCSFASPSDGKRSPQLGEALANLINLDYGLFTETLAHSVFGWEQGEAAHRIALYMQDALSAEAARACWAANEQMDVSDLLPLVQAPTLVLHRRDFPMIDLDGARRLAAGIPRARLKILEGASLSPYLGDTETALKTIFEFIGSEAPKTGAANRPHRHKDDGRADAGGFRTIMFTDMEGSTAVTQRLGDAAAQELVRVHNSIVADALAGFAGKQVKHTGDGIMASFLTTSAAVECAIAIQQGFAEYNDANPAAAVKVRIGINAGEPVEEGDDLFGTAVQLARRVCDSADPGEILTSDVVRQLVAGKGFLFSDEGEAVLRGFEDPVRLYEVRWHRDGG